MFTPPATGPAPICTNCGHSFDIRMQPDVGLSFAANDPSGRTALWFEVSPNSARVTALGLNPFIQDNRTNIPEEIRDMEVWGEMEINFTDLHYAITNAMAEMN
jgi:hypothetical protein